MDDPDPTPVDSRSGRPGHWTGTLRADLGMSSWTLSPSASSDISTPPFNQTWHPSVMPFDGDWWHWRQPVQLAAPESSECAVTLSTAAGDPVRGVADIYVVPGSFPLRYEYLVRPMADEAVVHAAYADRTPDDGMPCPDDGPTDYPLGTSASLDLTGREPPDTSPYVDRIASCPRTSRSRRHPFHRRAPRPSRRGRPRRSRRRRTRRARTASTTTATAWPTSPPTPAARPPWARVRPTSSSGRRAAVRGRTGSAACAAATARA